MLPYLNKCGVFIEKGSKFSADELASNNLMAAEHDQQTAESIPDEAEPLSVERQQSPRPHRLGRFGRRALIIAGVSLIGLAATAPSVSAAPEGQPNGAGGTPTEPVPANPAAPSAPAQTPSGLAPSISVTSEPPAVGVATYDSLTDDPHLYSDMSKVGMTVIRETVSREQYPRDMAVLHKDIGVAANHGIDVVVNLGQGPDYPLAGFPKWAARMAQELPHVQRFIIANEVNSPLFWHHTMKQYVDMLYKTDNAIHAVRPDAVVSGFGLASGYAPLPYLERADRYATAKYGGLQNIQDRLSYHLYRRPLANEALAIKYQKIWPYGVDVDEFGTIVRNSGQPKQLPAYATRTEQAQYNLAFMNWAGLFYQQGVDILNYRMENSTDPLDLKTGLITVKGDRLPSYHAVGDFTTGGLAAESGASNISSFPFSQDRLLPAGSSAPAGLNPLGQSILARMIRYQEYHPVPAG